MCTDNDTDFILFTDLVEIHSRNILGEWQVRWAQKKGWGTSSSPWEHSSMRKFSKVTHAKTVSSLIASIHITLQVLLSFP